MAGVITVPCWEMSEGQQEGCNDQGPWAIKTFFMEWSNRRQFSLDMKGFSGTSGPSSPWNRPQPFGYPDPVSGVTLYAKDILIDPLGDIILGSDPIEWTHAKATVTFGLLSYTVDFSVNDPLFLNSLSTDPTENESLQYATQELDFGSNLVPIPPSCVSFLTGGAKYNVHVYKRETIIDMVVTWNRYPLLPMDLIATYANKVNNATFLGRATGTVMLDGAKTVREQEPDGTITQKVQMHFKWREEDWNKEPREDTGAYDLIIINNDPDVVRYLYRDFSQLLL